MAIVSSSRPEIRNDLNQPNEERKRGREGERVSLVEIF